MRRKPTQLQRIYEHAHSGQLCSVPGCHERAVWTAVLVDYYEGEVGWFFEQDYTCPFICQQHKLANGMGGQRFTNLGFARGHSEYRPIAAVAQTTARLTRR